MREALRYCGPHNQWLYVVCAHPNTDVTPDIHGRSHRRYKPLQVFSVPRLLSANPIAADWLTLVVLIISLVWMVYIVISTVVSMLTTRFPERESIKVIPCSQGYKALSDTKLQSYELKRINWPFDLWHCKWKALPFVNEILGATRPRHKDIIVSLSHRNWPGSP